MNKSSWKFLIAFAAIILLVLAGYWIWDNQLSLETKESDEPKATYEEAIEYQKQLEEAMRADTSGGKTPEETLRLFIEALRKENVDLAFQYFVLEENGERDPKWREGLIKTRDAGKLQEVADLLSKAKPEEGRVSENDFKLSIREGRELKAYINLQFNQYSGVWKIESL